MKLHPDERCTYCNTPDPCTRDHAAPKCLYAKPRAANLITVPCCLDCNKRLGAKEEQFREIVAGLLVHNRATDYLWDGPLSRSFDRSPSVEDRLYNHLQVVIDRICLSDAAHDIVTNISVKTCAALLIYYHEAFWEAGYKPKGPRLFNTEKSPAQHPLHADSVCTLWADGTGWWLRWFSELDVQGRF